MRLGCKLPPLSFSILPFPTSAPQQQTEASTSQQRPGSEPSWSLDWDGAVSSSSGPLKRPHKIPEHPPWFSLPAPGNGRCLPCPRGNKASPSAKARTRQGGFIYSSLMLVSVPKVKSCWLTVFPAWVFPARPVFHPPHPGPPPPRPQAPPPCPLPGHRKTDSGALRSFLSRKLAPTGSGLSPGHPLVRVRTAADYTPVSLTGQSRATLLPGPARQLHLHRDALRHSVPLPL